MVALMSDPTLRDGDAVMTAKGLTIFEGASGRRVHHLEDFVAVQKATNVPLKNRERMAAVGANVQSLPSHSGQLARPAASIDLIMQQVADK
jgi:hypothetical protein